MAEATRRRLVCEDKYGRLFSGSGDFFIQDSSSEYWELLAKIPIPLHDIPGKLTRREAEQLTRLICLAVNNHEALLGALRHSIHRLSAYEHSVDYADLSALLAKIEKEAKS